jgi:zinc and cadmium transporter
MSTLGYILLFTFIGSVGSLIGGLILLSKEKLALKISHFLASFAAGTLLGTAFFDLLPEAAHEAERHDTDIFLWTLVGIIIFFFIERFIHWFHHHEDFHEHSDEKKSTLPLIIISDTTHNFIDGVVIAATFMVSIPLGVATTLAVAAHEIPQEIGDFGLMLHKGLAKKKIILVNVLSACAAFAGAIITYLLGNILDQYIAIFLAITAGFFIYIASSDLIPEIHHEKRKGFAIVETLLLLAGIVFVWFAVTSLEHAH